MPNHVTNNVKISGKAEDIKDIFSSLKTDKSDFDFNEILPMPEELTDTVSSTATPKNQDLIDKFGFDNWYDWSLQNWGTKWNAYEVSTIDVSEVQFDTAWSCSDTLIQKLSKLHPNVEFVLTYADEDLGSNCGIITYKNGTQTNYIDKSMGNLEDNEASLRWAMVVKYGSDDDYEEWYGEEEVEEF